MKFYLSILSKILIISLPAKVKFSFILDLKINHKITPKINSQNKNVNEPAVKMTEPKKMSSIIPKENNKKLNGVLMKEEIINKKESNENIEKNEIMFEMKDEIEV
jgi:hypothetical protein